MHIRKLELRGFKSFPDPTAFHFSRGISGIVGPNGCGKSNVVDAVRWCLGEQSAKRLRGQAMQDIIFAGSAERAELGKAEVSLTFEAADEPFPGEYSRLDELQVTRRVTRDGGSEYLINQQKVRLKDVQELFLDSGASNPLYSIIEQGRIGEIVRARPEDRRSLIEEAAGISRYKVKRKEAEGRLKETRANLERVTDVVDGLGSQLRKLEKQVGKVIRYRRLRTQQRQGDILLGLARYHGLSGDRKALTNQLRSAQAAERTLARDLERRDLATREDREREAHLDAQVGKFRDQLAETEASRREKESARQYLKREHTDLTTRREQASRQLGAAREERQAAQSRLAAVGREMEEVSEEIRGLEGMFETEQESVRLAESAARERRRRVESGRTAVLERTREKARLAARIEAGQAREEELQQRLEQLAEEASAAGGDLHAADQEIGAVREAETAAETLVGSIQERETAARTGLKQAEQARSEAIQAQRRSDELLSRAERSAARARARLDSLRGVHESREGVGADLGAVLGAEGVVGTLAECLEVEAAAMPAIEVALGALLDAVLVEDATAAEAVLDATEGRRTVLIVGPSDDDSLAPTGLPGVQGTPAARVALRTLLGATTEGASLQEAVAQRFNGAVLVGDSCVVMPGGLIHAGREGSAGAAVLERKRQLAALEEEHTVAQAAVEAARTAAESARVERQKVVQALDLARAALDVVRTELAEARLELEGARRRRAELERSRKREAERAERLVLARSRAESALASLSTELVEAEAKVGLADSAIERLEAELRVEQQALLGEGAAVEAARERLGERASELTGLRERLRGQQRARGAEETALRTATRTEKEAEVSLQAARTRLTEIETEQTTLAEELARLAQLQEVVRGSLDEESGRLGAVRERLATADQERDEVRQRRDAAVQQRMELEQSLTTTKAGIAAVRDALQERYELSVAGLMDRLDRMGAVVIEVEEGADGDSVPESARPRERADEAVEDLRITAAMLDDTELLEGWTTRVDTARARLARLGEVNLIALQEYEELSSEHGQIDSQRADLERSVDTIRRTIARLNRVSRERFRETFERVDGYFRELYPRLVGGGKARLRLTNEDDLLETGVEVFVQPPGKRLQALSLLSGGETAMVAIALIFSLFRVKPSPFCLLDEVDAPLDEANGSRFNLMLAEMANLSQFIVITHNKKTMEAVETLYGVTMPRPGVSRLVTVALD